MKPESARVGLGRLSSPVEALRPHYQVVVVGSGYGGAVAAARLVRPGRSVCVLERGRELRPGDYPASLAAALRNIQIDGEHGHYFSRTALYDLRLNGDLKVLVGCGLGGTSLINANVVIPPEGAVFTDDAWPRPIRQEAARGALAPYFAEAKSMLDAVEYPCDDLPRKYLALDRIVRRWKDSEPGGRTRIALTKAPVAVTFPRDDRNRGFQRNRWGVMQHPCTGCGDCVSGCNVAAKNTVLMNYLPVARARDAAIFTEMKVTSVQPRGERGGWLVHYEPLGARRRQFSAPPLSIAADTVVLAAGALGSTEILLRSRDTWQLPLSERVGTSFSGNGDVLSFAYNGREIVNGIGAGRGSFHGAEAPGPCITGSVALADKEPIRLQEGVIPGALSPILTVGFVLARILKGRDPMTSRRRSLWRLVEDYARGGMAATQTFLAMVNDRSYGRLELVDDRIKVVWSGAGRGGVYEELVGLVEEACAALDAAYVPNPFGAITVHPLGGCPMGDNGTRGAVDHTGAVFTGQGTGIHDGLFVWDGSTIPCALGANPLFTITALAERAAALMTGPRR